ncbi:hypothetical protein AAHE18_05G275300 [Arachis hypogaea]
MLKHIEAEVQNAKQQCSSAAVGASGATSVSHHRRRAVYEANVSHLCSRLRAATFRRAVSSEIRTTASAAFHRAVYSRRHQLKSLSVCLPLACSVEGVFELPGQTIAMAQGRRNME